MSLAINSTGSSISPSRLEKPRQQLHPDVATSNTEWARQPTTLQVLLSPALPYQPPRSAVGVFVWRRRVWFETTFALSMLQPWEKVLAMLLLCLSLGFSLIGIYLYLPSNLAYSLRRQCLSNTQVYPPSGDI
ncbi:hypothetical protein AcW2_007597 [Taiwanofungus camphoratus]|nr:hypothetical protein AcW2_007597 [Antrodia cinnamomea]